jgi:ABC-type transporter Mla maintaining outer membrane lipid asymmetry ATPase subunit MlaF
VIVTHELASIEKVTDRAVMIGRGGVIATGTIQELEKSEDEDIYNFFHRVAG